jgi:hypothetical protein
LRVRVHFHNDLRTTTHPRKWLTIHCNEGCTKTLVACNQCIDRPAQSADLHCALKAYGDLDHVEPMAWHQPVEKP